MSVGAVAQLDAHPPRMRIVTGSILTSGNIFSWIFGHEIISTANLSLPLIQIGQCQLLVKGHDHDHSWLEL